MPLRLRTCEPLPLSQHCKSIPSCNSLLSPRPLRPRTCAPLSFALILLFLPPPLLHSIWSPSTSIRIAFKQRPACISEPYPLGRTMGIAPAQLQPQLMLPSASHGNADHSPQVGCSRPLLNFLPTFWTPCVPHQILAGAAPPVDSRFYDNLVFRIFAARLIGLPRPSQNHDVSQWRRTPSGRNELQTRGISHANFAVWLYMQRYAPHRSVDDAASSETS